MSCANFDNNRKQSFCGGVHAQRVVCLVYLVLFVVVMSCCGGTCVVGESKFAKYTVSLFAGYSDEFGNGGEAIDATLTNPYDMFFSSVANSLYITDLYRHAIRKVSLTDGKISLFQNDAGSSYNYRGITGDESLVYYTSDNSVYFTNTLYYSSSNLVAGATAGFSGDGGKAINAQLNNPTGIFYSTIDTSLYICDSGNHRIRKMDMNTRIITTIAGNGNNSFSGDGYFAVNATLSYPQGVYVSQTTGEIYISDSGNHRVRKILTNGTIVTLVGTNSVGFNSDSTGLATSLNNPIKLWMNKLETELYISDMGNNRVRKYDTVSGLVTTIAGGGSFDTNSISATQAQLYEPRSIMRNSLTEEWYILESKADRISALSLTGILRRFCGSPYPSAFNSNPFNIQLSKSYGVTQVQNILYITQSLSHSILQLQNSQMYSYGIGSIGYAGDGLVLDSNTQFNFPTAITFSSGTKAIYIADTYNHRIRKIDPTTNIITSIAGTGSPGYNGDGIQATTAKLNNPFGISVWYDNQTKTDTIYIADTFNNKIRKISSNGVIETIIGLGAITLWYPHAVSNLPDGRLLTADTFNKRIILTNTADNSSSEYLTSTENLISVAAIGGYIYVADSNSYIYKVDPNVAPTYSTLSTNGRSFQGNPQAIGFSDNSTNIFIANTYVYTIDTVTDGDLTSPLRRVGDYVLNQDRTLATKMKVTDFSNMFYFNGELYVVVDRIVYKIKSDGKIEKVLGTYSKPTENQDIYYNFFLISTGLVIRNGVLYISQSSNGRILTFDLASKIISKFAGSASPVNINENVDAKNITITPAKMAYEGDNLYFFDYFTVKLKKISFSTNLVTTVAGGGSSTPKTTPSAPLTSSISIQRLTVSPIDKQVYFLDDSFYFYLRTVTSTSLNYLDTKIGTGKYNGLAIASDGTIFVGSNLGISRYVSSSTFTNITLPFLSSNPSEIVVGSNGEIYVSETLKIYKLTPYCESDYSLNVTQCLPICFGVVGENSCGGSLQGSCVAPNSCQCNAKWSGPQCTIAISTSFNQTNSGGLANNNGQTILIAVLVPVLVILFIIILIVIIVAFVIVYMKLKKQGSSVTGSVVKSRENFEMKDVNASTFDRISDFPTDDSYFRGLSSSMSSITNSEATFDPIARYKDLTKIGEGAFGSVFKAFDSKTNKTKALKIIRFKSFGELNSIMKEGMQLMNINHPNILKVNDLFVDKQEILCMDMEFYEKGDLSIFVKESMPCSEAIVKQIVYQMCSALDFVHTNLKSIHRDVKLSNIFIKSLDDSSIHTILADFGLAKDSQASAMQSYAGTPLYMSPELGLGASYTSNTDIWSLGVTIYQLMTKDNTTAISHLYLSKDEKQVCEILHDKMKQGSNYSEELISICLRMLTKDSASRPSAKDILKDPYFANLD